MVRKRERIRELKTLKFDYLDMPQEVALEVGEYEGGGLAIVAIDLVEFGERFCPVTVRCTGNPGKDVVVVDAHRCPSELVKQLKWVKIITPLGWSLPIVDYPAYKVDRKVLEEYTIGEIRDYN